MKKANIIILLTLTVLLSGCNNKAEVEDTVITNHAHSDLFVALEYKTDEQRIEDIVPVEQATKEEINADLSDYTTYGKDEELIEEPSITIDFSSITPPHDSVFNLIKDMYNSNGFTSHSVISESYSENPEEEFEYYLVLRFNTNEVYAIYYADSNAYAIKDEYGIYDNYELEEEQ